VWVGEDVKQDQVLLIGIMDDFVRVKKQLQRTVSATHCSCILDCNAFFWNSVLLELIQKLLQFTSLLM